jgi:hypothetical protein
MSAARRTQVIVARELLLARIADQRGVVAQQAAGLAPVLRLVDRAGGAVGYVRRHPALAAVAGLALVVLRGRMLLGLGMRAFGIWRLVRRARGLLRHAGY